MEQIVLDYLSQKRQQLFHSCPADEVLYGGAAGGGKSEAMLHDALKNALKYPNCKIIMFRRTFPDLERSLILRSRAIYPQSVGKYNEAKKRWTFINGSTIEFAYMKRESDVANYQGAEYDFIYWDELTHFTLHQYTYMISRLRGSNPAIKRQIKAATNPGGVGHAWVKERFIDIGEYERIHRPTPSADEPSPGTRCFIPAKLQDNTKLMEADPGYLQRLENLPEALRRQLLDGNWDSFDGMAFSEWDKEIHIVKPFQIPDTWKRFRAIDYGRSAPFCCLWFAMDQDHHIYVYREAYKAGLDATDQAKLIKELSDGERIQYTVLDSACWIPNQHGESIADTYSDIGVYCDQASKNRINGKDRVHAWLKVLEDNKGRKYSRLRVFENCRNLIRTMPSLPLHQTHVEDVDTDAEDHAYDTLRYGVMSCPDPREYESIDNVASRASTQDHLPWALREEERPMNWSDY
ncbi:terminase large subunit domain-containing protein [Paenibacillus spongiae]|uniref:Terminase family protein n=1 Tax=Paenibacillus spongiae TaxID=2909671 RepID=A0ABY5SCF2_9BACL|nr:terminase family protein [Paenibacillus spongiae]UVI31208.1 terminase family protein [Paenibacillus spongiae]